MSRHNNSDEMSVEEHLTLLLTDNKDVICDDTTTVIVDDPSMPSWYDDVKFKRGQAYFHANILGMFTGKMCGLLSLLAIPHILRYLTLTGMSGTTYKAYKRYVATIQHMCQWYDNKFEPESSAWKSMILVRKMHCAASKLCRRVGYKGITQKDMALTQFGFMGFALVRPKSLGISTDNIEDIEAFVHFWRVIGWLLGIDDKYNMCRNSVEETKQVCEVVLRVLFAPGIRSNEPNFVQMRNALLEGMWFVNPFIHTSSFIAFTYRLSKRYDETEEYDNKLNKLMEPYRRTVDAAQYRNSDENTRVQFTRYTYSIFVLMIIAHEKLFRSVFYKWFSNCLMYLCLYLMNHFPYLAYIKYGIRDSHVDIFKN